ncbi:hypothetical protein DPMN_082133 [Dreissena polymorpha]|uniref:HTH psq-type domain-containing protein n=1 Tax=Dreissena polymorpha TaxID=45954 RepID=A0A9D3Y7K4_DREPO|nr:hypothetical protein DPMN_082133 [Dreissena polymorpha]
MPKKYVHTKRGNTMRYSVSDLQKAVDAVQSKQLSIRKASETFAVPKSTIADRITGNMLYLLLTGDHQH